MANLGSVMSSPNGPELRCVSLNMARRSRTDDRTRETEKTMILVCSQEDEVVLTEQEMNINN